MTAEDQNNEGGGYKRPPRHTQFKKGKSGNPKGRPKTEILTMGDRLLAELNTKVEVNESGKRRMMTKGDVAVKRLVNGALNNDPKAWAVLIKIMPEIEKKLPPRRVIQQIKVSWMKPNYENDPIKKMET